MKTEKLTAAYCFVRAWRTISYAGLLIGCLTSFAWMFYTFGDGITEFFSEFSAKSEAKDKHAAYEEECEQEIENAKKALEEYIQTLPQRLEAIKQQHAQELAQHKEQTRIYSNNIKDVVSGYNKVAAVAEEELKKLQSLNASDIHSLKLSIRELTSMADYQTFQSEVQEKSGLISRYQSKVQDSVMSKYAEYEAPVLAKVDELSAKERELTNRIESTKEDYKQRIARLEAEKKDVPTARYEARPEINLYGTTDVESLKTILDATDILPLLAAQLGSTAPQTENGRCNLRKSLLHMSSWLPIQTRTYAPSQDEINAVHEHNRAIEEKISGLYRERDEIIQTLHRELRATTSELSVMEDRKSELRKQKDLLSGLAASATQKWEISSSMDQVQNKMNAPFPADPASLESKLQREKDRIPQKEQELQQMIQATQKSIASSEERLDQQLAALSAKEREACAAAILQPFPFRTLIGGSARLIENPFGLITGAVTDALPKQDSLIPLDFVNDAINSLFQFSSPFGAAGKAYAAVATSLPISYIFYGILLIGSWFSFAILMVAADYLICPLVRTTKIQEIEYNLRRDETK